MCSKKHINYDELLKIYKFISLGYSLKAIIHLVNKNRSTIYRLIINNSKWNKGSSVFASLKNTRFKDCSHLLNCKRNGITSCPSSCPNYKKWICPKLRSFPYICNFCEQRYTCKKEKRLFNPEEAYIQREDKKSESKRNPNISRNDLKRLDETISPLIKQGLSIETIYSTLGSICPVSSRTIRNYIDRGYLEAKRIDLRNAVKREYKDTYKYKRVSNNPLLKVGRTWTSLMEYLTTHNKDDIIQFDTVHGKKSDKKCILTIHHPASKFQIGRLLDNFTANEVMKQIDEIRSFIGDDYYFKFFRILVCDNGPEFDKMPDLEVDDETGEVYARVFYTRPYRSGDKGSCERNHELFRYVIAKGKSLDDLTQDDVNFIFSNINSYPRKSLNYQCPIDVVNSMMGKDFATRLKIIKIPFKQLTFKKKLK